MPASRDLGSRLRQARIRASLFHKAPTPLKIDRFSLLERIGTGAMGEVYAAYDERLDRKVAIKLVHGDTGGSPHADRRLLREARTLARLSHPNVVQIYDAGIFEGRVFIAMEFIRGQTMGQWLRSVDHLPRRKRVREILRRFVAAGRGLQAAHEAGLTHRDFKPDNILVSDTGRVVVVDFGLARMEGLDVETDSDADEEHAAPPPTNISATEPGESDLEHASPGMLTPEGTVLGTPAYMAPEVFEGQAAGSRSDQFSFCVALHEALHGERPFRGADIHELRRAILHGQPAAGAREAVVPMAVRKALARGLARNADDRFADMGKLLHALEQHPGRRLLWLAALVTALLAALAYGWHSRAADAPVCAGADEALAPVWNPARSGTIEQVMLGTGSEYAREAWPRVQSGLDGYARTWAWMHRDACMAHRQGRQSARMLDARMICLERRLGALRSALAVLEEIDARSLSKAVQVVDSLPPLDYCGNTAALQAEIAPPEDAARQREVEELREQLSRAGALEVSGRYGDALAIAAQVVARAESIGYRPLEAEALLAQGRVTMQMGSTMRAKSIEPLRRAVELSLEVGMDATAVEAYARLVFARGTRSRDSTALLEFAPMIESISKRSPDASFVRALLLNNIGAVHMAREQPELARDYFERAVAIQRHSGQGGRRIELVYAAQNLAMVTPDAARRQELMNTVAGELERTLGPSHPQTLRQRVHYSSYVPDPRAARAILEPACERYRKSDQPEALDGALRCLYLLGFLAAELDDHDQAAAVYRELGERIPADTAAYRVMAALVHGFALLHEHRNREALAAFEAARAALPESPEQWWIQKDIGDAYLGLGTAQRALSSHAEAIVSLSRACELFERLGAISYNAEYQQRLARARLELARSLRLVAGGKVTAEARVIELGEQAAAWYRSAGQEQRAHAITNWLRQSGVITESR